MENMLDISGKIALVTGGGAGIGKATAILLAKAGASVAVCDIKGETAQETAEEIAAMGRKALALPCDITKPKEVEVMVEKVALAFGTINILVNNVGGGGGGREIFLELTDEYIRSMYEWNVFSVYRLSILCAPYMIESQYGSIINISSLASIVSDKSMSVYSSVKSAVNKLTASMAVDLGPHVRVNAIGPGAIKTQALATVLTPELEEEMLKETPLKRLGVPEDIAKTVLFFASPASSWISGQTIFVSGGGIQKLD